jgi:hypothetical protein
MTNIDVQAVVAQIDALEQKRSKFKAIGIACGLGAIFPFWTAIFGPLFFFAWLAALICGFVFRGVAVRARDEAMRLRLSIANLPGSPYNSTNFETKVAAPAAWVDSAPAPAGAPAPTAPATPSPKAAAKPSAQTTASRLDKARRRSE